MLYPLFYGSFMISHTESNRQNAVYIQYFIQETLF
jgi:hypothetical protein